MNDSWPDFLDRLDQDPDGAFADFYALTCQSLQSVPPRPLKAVPKDEWLDRIHEVVYHCCRDSFAALRRYKDRGKPFVAWLHVVAHNRIYSVVNPQLDKPQIAPLSEDSGKHRAESAILRGGGSPELRAQLAQLQEAVRKALGGVGDKCRTLLKMAADEWTPQEMASVLRQPPATSKKISDDLRYCRRRLRDMLYESGVDVEDFFPKS